MGARATAVQPDASARTDVLVEPDWLEAHLHDPTVRVVQVDVSSAAYDAGHIDGAALWNIYGDLKDSHYRPVDRTAVAQLLARSGITAQSTVVFCGYGPAMGFWLLRLYRHTDARILNCTPEAWRAEGRPWTTDTPVPPTTNYPLPDEDTTLRIRCADVVQAISDPRRALVDVRSEAEFHGERFWPSGGMEAGGRAGHIPSAIHVPVDTMYDKRGTFRGADDLAQVFAPALSTNADELITYCTIGSRAATAWFILTYLFGHRHVRVYDGSWAEWGLTETTPVTRP